MSSVPVDDNQVIHAFSGSSVDRNKYQIQIPLPPKIDASVTMMQVEEKPDVTYSDVGGCKEQDRKSTRLNSSHSGESRMPSSA